MKNKKNMWKLPGAVVLILVLAISSCKKSSSGGNEQPAIAVKVEHGTPEGAAVEKTIGPAGGNIVAGDGRMSITVPAGAVKVNTVFAIQPVKNTLTSGSGLSYRLLPDNINFEQDLELSFSYTGEDIDDSNEDFLFLAYQDSEGYWHRARKTSLDKTNKVLKVKTKHFSDWTVEKSLRIYVNGKKNLSANEEVVLEVWGDQLTEPVNPADNDWLLSLTNLIEGKNVKEWKKYYDGTITAKNNRTQATYKAPAKITSSSTVIAEVTLLNLVNAESPNSAGNTGMVILRTELKLVGEEYFDWSLKGQKFTGGDFIAKSDNNYTSLSAYNGDNTLSIMIRGAGTGSYSIGDMNEGGKMGLTAILGADAKTYTSSHTPCGGDKKQYEQGNLTITRFDAAGGYIEGNISANLVSFKDCSTTSGMLLGTFRIKRQ
ncbi:MAG: hypothetical protein QM731_09825 [Chitinophagaceae bacterium]